MSKSHGACISKQRAIEFLTEEVQDHLPKEKWIEYEKAVNRVRYEFDKLDEVKPILYKAQRKQYDYWKCGNCGAAIRDVTPNYCQNCGFKIKWDSPRCLTGSKS